MNARSYYRQAHEIPKATPFVQPHVEDSGPSGRVCFRRGTYRNRTDVVCSYPAVTGQPLDFWAVSDPINGDSAEHVLIGEDVPHGFDGSPTSLPIYKSLHDVQVGNFDNYKAASDWDEQKKDYRVYAPRVRCSRLAFVGGLGYGPGQITLPAKEHPVSVAPTPTADAFVGWYGFDTGNRSGGIIRQVKTGSNPDTYAFSEEGWGRPAFDFTPLAGHADQDWAYAPATPSRAYDTQPAHGTTTIKAGSWVDSKVKGAPMDNFDFPNWWLLGMVGGDPQHGKTPGSNPPVSAGKATPLYWNPANVKTLTYFGEAGTDDLTTQLYLTILRRIYARHCKTPAIDPLFAGIPFPPGFLVDVRILAETWECKCSDYLCFAKQSDGRGYERGSVKIFSTIRPDAQHPTKDMTVKHYIYLGTHFVVDYKCPFPLWRRQVA